MFVNARHNVQQWIKRGAKDCKGTFNAVQKLRLSSFFLNHKLWASLDIFSSTGNYRSSQWMYGKAHRHVCFSTSCSRCYCTSLGGKVSQFCCINSVIVSIAPTLLRTWNGMSKRNKQYHLVMESYQFCGSWKTLLLSNTWFTVLVSVPNSLGATFSTLSRGRQNGCHCHMTLTGVWMALGGKWIESLDLDFWMPTTL